MIVIGIMGIIVAMGIPMVYHALHREGLTKAVNDVEEVLGNARRLAILQGTMTEVIFHPRDLRCEVAGGGGGKPPPKNSPSASFATTPPPPPPPRVSTHIAAH